MTGSPCPAVASWHAHVDADAVADPAALAHLQGCPACREIVADLRRVDAFFTAAARDANLDGLVDRTVAAALSVVRAEHAAAASRGPAMESRSTREARAGAGGDRRAAAIGVVLACLGCLAYVLTRDRGATPSAVEAGTSAGRPHGGLPDHDEARPGPAPVRDEAAPFIFALATAPRFATETPFPERLEEALVGASHPAAALRRAEALIREEPLGAVARVKALERLLEFGGPTAEPAVHRLLRGEKVPPEAAAALYARMVGREATFALVASAMSAVASEEIVRAASTRPGVAEAVDALYPPKERAARLPAAIFAARVGHAGAIADLAEEARRSPEPRAALRGLARAPGDEPVLALARFLPTPDAMIDEAPAAAAEAEVADAASTAPDLGDRAARLAARTTRSSDRRRLLLLAGLSRDPAVTPILCDALLRAEDADVASAAMRRLGSGAAAPSLAAAWRRTSDRPARRRLLATLAGLPGPEPVHALVSLLEHAEVRAAAVRVFASRPECALELVRCLAYADVRSEAAAALRRRFGADSPSHDDPNAWTKVVRARSPR